MKRTTFVSGITLSMLLCCPSLPAELVDCPPGNAEKEFVFLQSNSGEQDGKHCVKLLVKGVADQSLMIKNMLEDLGKGGDAKGVIPFPEMTGVDDTLLLQIAEILEAAPNRVQYKLGELTQANPARLLRIIKALNFLDVPHATRVALDGFAAKILQDDVDKLGKWNEGGYAIYKKAFLEIDPFLQASIIRRTLKVVKNRPRVLATLHGHSEGGIRSVAFSPDGTRILTAASGGGGRGGAELWDAHVKGDNSQPLARLTDEQGLMSAAFSPDGSRILTGSFGDTAKLWNANVRGVNSQPLATLTGTGWVSSVAFSPDGTRFLTGSRDFTAKLWDAKAREDNRRLLATFKHPDMVTSVAFSPDGTRVLTGCDDSKARVWDANARSEVLQPLATLIGNRRPISSVAFNRDGTQILAVYGGDVKLWASNLKGDNYQMLSRTELSWGQIDSAVFSPDDLWILTGSQDSFTGKGIAEIWDAADVRAGKPPPRPIAALVGHDELVNSVAFSPDGTRALTGFNDGTAKLWILGLDENKLSLAEAQIILYIEKNNLSKDRVPRHLLAALGDYARGYLFDK